MKYSSALTGSLAHNWFNDNLYITSLLNAFSIALPLGEKLFMKSVNEHVNLTSDAQLKSDIKMFISQEAAHSKAHNTYNEQLCLLKGYDKNKLEKNFNSVFNYMNKTSPKERLACTVTMEHITAILSYLFLSIPREELSIESSIYEFWACHAREEIEHKSVAFDLYMSVYDDRSTLQEVMKNTLKNLISLYKITSCQMLTLDRIPVAPFKQWLVTNTENTKTIYHKFESMINEFYNPDFHPLNINTTNCSYKLT